MQIRLKVRSTKPLKLLNAIANLELLEKILILEATDLYSLPNFSECYRLNEMALHNCKILRDISSLSNCQNLIDFALLESNVTDFTPISSCKKLRRIAFLEDDIKLLEIDTNIFSVLPELELLKVGGISFSNKSRGSKYF